MMRERATKLLDQAILQVIEGGDTWPARLVSAIWVFGSYARGALEPGDVDIAVDLDRDDPDWSRHFISCFSYGRSPYAIVARLMRNGRRGIQFIFEREHGHEHVPMTLLWRRGESHAEAMRRVHAIPADASAGRAERDFMIPPFEELDHWLPRYVREELIQLINEGNITLEQIQLADGIVEDLWANEVVEHRWQVVSSPLRRAALAALAHLEGRGIDLASVHLHGRDIDADEPVTPYFVGFELRYIPALRRCFDKHGGVEWIEVVHPTRRQAIRALVIRRGPGFSSGISDRYRGGFFR